MIKPNMPNTPGTPSFPGMGAVTDSLEFVKNLWGGMGIPGMNMSGMNMSGMNIPGMVVPTFSVEDIKKKVADLRAVETWLELNMNMLRGTIQALEVQAATISTLQSMGDALSATVSSSAGGFAQGAQQNQAAPTPSSSPPSPEQKMSSAPEPTSRDEANAASLTAPLVNAAAWWNMLQDQFKQAVGSTVAAEAPAAPAAAAKTKSDSNGASAPSRKRKPAK